LAGRKSVILSEMGGIVVRHHHSQGAFHVLNSLEIKVGGFWSRLTSFELMT
jgi:hypothetical protein